MEARCQQGGEAFMKRCEANPDSVREGYSFANELVIAWNMLLSKSLIKKGIRINCTMPGPTETPMMKEFESATKASVLEAAAQTINRRSTPEEQDRKSYV